MIKGKCTNVQIIQTICVIEYKGIRMKIIILFFFICTIYLSHSDSSNCPKSCYRINKQKGWKIV